MKKREIAWILVFITILLAACGGEQTGLAQGKENIEATLDPEKAFYVLMYHSVAPDGTQCGDWTITESKFREHMQWLKDQGYTPVAPSAMAAGEPLPEKPILITFDDGYTDNYTRALPILQEFGFPAVISLVTSYIGVEEGFMDWDMARQMAESGLVEFGSHTHNLHRYPGLQRLEGERQGEYEQRAFPDLQQSVELIEENLGVKPVYFAYPHGIADEWVVEEVCRLFPVNVTSVEGGNDPAAGYQNLCRYNINDNTVLSNLLP